MLLQPANPVVRAALEAVLDQKADRSDAQVRVERLKAAALIECAEKGYYAVSVSQIAERAKVSTASIYTTYNDRDALLVSALEMLFAILADDVIEVPTGLEPIAQVEQLLLAHGGVYQQPLTIWLFRLFMTITCRDEHPHLRDMGARIFSGIDAFWCSYLNRLVQQGHLRALEADMVVPLLLGAVERCTIVASLMCGEETAERPRLAEVARHATELLFRRWGNVPLANTSENQDQALVYWDNLAFDRQVHAIQTGPSLVSPNWQEKLQHELDTFRNNRHCNNGKKRMLLATALICRDSFYEGAAIKDIAARARVSTASVYKLFPDKKALFVEAVEAGYHALPRLTDDILINTEKALQTALAIFILAKRAVDHETIWMNHIVAVSDLSGSIQMVDMARRDRYQDEVFLAKRLHESGADSISEKDALQVNFLLGGVTRRGLLSLLLFGEKTVDTNTLARLAVAADWHLN